MTILLYDLVGADEKRPYSPHCWKAAMALAHKGLSFRRVPTRTAQAVHSILGAKRLFDDAGVLRFILISPPSSIFDLAFF